MLGFSVRALGFTAMLSGQCKGSDFRGVNWEGQGCFVSRLMQRITWVSVCLIMVMSILKDPPRMSSPPTSP